MFEGLHHILSAWDQNPEIRLIILEGSGRGFCAGGDLKEFCDPEKGGGEPFCRTEYRLDYRIHHLSTPVLSILDGFVMGGGAGLGINAHFRIGTEQIIFSMPEVLSTLRLSSDERLATC